MDGARISHAVRGWLACGDFGKGVAEFHTAALGGLARGDFRDAGCSNFTRLLAAGVVCGLRVREILARSLWLGSCVEISGGWGG